MGPEDLFVFKDTVNNKVDKGVVAEEIGEISSKEDALLYKGLPYTGKPYTVDKDCLPILSRKVHIKQFNLDDATDMSEYNIIFQDRADGKNDISFEERVYDKDLKSWRVLLRWFDLVYTEPKIKKEVTDDE